MRSSYTVVLEQKRSIGVGVVVMSHVEAHDDIEAGDDARNTLAHPQHWDIITVREE